MLIKTQTIVWTLTAGLCFALTLSFAACTPSEKPPAPAEKNIAEGTTAAPVPAAPAEAAPVPAAPEKKPDVPAISPEARKVLDLAESQWASLNSLRASMETYMAFPCDCDEHRIMMGAGAFEYLKSDAKPKVRVEMGMKNLVYPKGEAMPDPAATTPNKVLHVFDGEDSFDEMRIAPPGGSPGAAPQPFVLKGHRESLDPTGFAGGFGDNMLKQYDSPGWKVSLLPDTVIEGRPVYVIEAKDERTGESAIPLSQIAPVQRVYVDKETGMPLRTELLQADKNIVGWMTMRNIERNPSLDAARFVYEPPAGVTVRDMATLTKPVPQSSE